MQHTMPIASHDTMKSGSENCLPIGTYVADFEIRSIIGEGGFGIVYLAFDHSLRRLVALKEYMPGALARRGEDKSVTVRSQRSREAFETGLKSFINEARLLAQFDHPALIKVHRFWEENSTGYMAMRYYEGQTLKAVINNNQQPVTEAWLKGVLKPILEALDALYRVNILHRDISPENIMIQDNGEAVLLDFGAARQILSDMTNALTVILKPGYAPIEQYANDSTMAQGPWTDIYALSAVVYFAIVKKPAPTSVARVVKDQIELLQVGQHSGFSKEFLSAVDHGMAVIPKDRPQSIEEFRKELHLELSVPMPMSTAASGVLSINSLGNKNDAALSSRKKQPDTGSLRAAPFMAKKSVNRFQMLGAASVLCGLGLVGYFSLKPKVAPSIPTVADSSATRGKMPSASLPSHAADTIKNATVATTTGTASIPSPVHGSSVTKTTGLVQLNIKPWGTIFVDGVSKGVSPPLKKIALTAGKHEVRIVNPSFPSHTVEVVVMQNKEGKIKHDFSPYKK